MLRDIPNSPLLLSVATAAEDVACLFVPPAPLDAASVRFVEERWQEHLSKFPNAFSGTMVGLNSAALSSRGVLQLEVTTTSYAEYVATRHSHDSIPPTLGRANPLGLTIALISADGECAVTTRSDAADQNAGLLYFIGGYLEATPPSSNAVNQTILRECAEELGASCKKASVLGLAFDPHFWHPELFSIAISDQTSSEIRARWASAHDRSEAKDLSFVPVRELLNISPESKYSRMPVTWSFETCRFFLRSHWADLHESYGSEP